MLNQILISDSFAQSGEAAANQEFSIASFVPLILIFAVFYFLIVRPQSKKIKEHKEMVSGLKIGNKVITSGGIVGVIKDVFEKEDQVEVEISEGVRIKVLRNFVTSLLEDQDKKDIKEKKSKSKK